MVLLQGAAAGTDIEAAAEAAAGVHIEAGAELVNLNWDSMVGASIVEEIVAVNVGNGYISHHYDRHLSAHDHFDQLNHPNHLKNLNSLSLGQRDAIVYQN